MSKADWRPSSIQNKKQRRTDIQRFGYKSWNRMMNRCRNNPNVGNASYEDVAVCLEWRDSSVYIDWYCENYPLEIVNGRLVDKLDDKGRRWELDKDILNPDSKEYSPSNCCFVTKRLNMLLIDSTGRRGDLPLGVRMNGTGFQTGHNDYETGRNISKTFRCLPDAVDAFWKFKFKVVLAACEEVSDYDEELGEQVMSYYYWFKNKHYPKEMMK